MKMVENPLSRKMKICTSMKMVEFLYFGKVLEKTQQHHKVETKLQAYIG